MRILLKLFFIFSLSQNVLAGGYSLPPTDLSGMETGKVDYTDSTYTDTVAKAASAIQTESDPVWASEKSGYATGMPLYVESYTGDFKADGSVPMSGPFDGGGFGVTNLGSLQMPSMDTMTYTGAVSFLAYNPDTGLFEQSPHKMETYSRTISGVQGTNLQTVLNGLGTYLPAGVDITVKIADGTHTMTNAITFPNFSGSGTFTLTADTIVSNSAHRNQAATLDFTGINFHGLNVMDANVSIYVNNLKILGAIDGPGWSAVRIYRTPNMYVRYCHISCSPTGAIFGGQIGVRAWEKADIMINNTFVDNQYHACASGPNAFITPSDCNGTNNTKGYFARSGIITVYDGDMGDPYTLNGGLVIEGAGAILP